MAKSRPHFLKIASASCSFFRAQHHEHALLAFRQHHLIGAHALFAHRHLVEIQLDAEIAAGAHFDGRTGEAGGAHVLDRDDGTGLHQFQAGFQQAFFGERITDLNRGALFFDRVVEFRRGHGRAADAVAAGLGAEIDDGKADAFGLGQEDRVGFGKAGGEGIDQAVAVVAGMELDFAADGRNAEGVAVAADAGDDARRPGAGCADDPARRSAARSWPQPGARPW